MPEPDASAGVIAADATGDQRIIVVLDGDEVVDDGGLLGSAAIPV